MNTWSWSRAGTQHAPCMRTAVAATPAGTHSPQAGRPAAPVRPVPLLTQFSSQPERLCPLQVKLSRPLGCPLRQMEPPPPHCRPRAGKSREQLSPPRPLGRPPSLQVQQRCHRPAQTSGSSWRLCFLLTPCSAEKQGGLMHRALLWETRVQAPASDLLNSLQVPSPL